MSSRPVLVIGHRSSVIGHREIARQGRCQDTAVESARSSAAACCGHVATGAAATKTVAVRDPETRQASSRYAAWDVEYMSITQDPETDRKLGCLAAARPPTGRSPSS